MKRTKRRERRFVGGAPRKSTGTKGREDLAAKGPRKQAMGGAGRRVCELRRGSFLGLATKESLFLG